MSKRNIRIGAVRIGPGDPIAVQTMWKSRLERIDDGLLARLRRLSLIGCDILRFAVAAIEAFAGREGPRANVGVNAAEVGRV